MKVRANRYPLCARDIDSPRSKRSEDESIYLRQGVTGRSWRLSSVSYDHLDLSSHCMRHLLVELYRQLQLMHARSFGFPENNFTFILSARNLTSSPYFHCLCTDGNFRDSIYWFVACQPCFYFRSSGM